MGENELPVTAVDEAYFALTGPLPMPAATLANDLRRRIGPDRYGLEWHLPWWLGHAWGLDAETSQRLVTANVLGLAALRLRDDLADGEIAPADTAIARLTSEHLLDAALSIYRHLFPASDPIWQRIMSLIAPVAVSDDEGATSSVARAAPVKISAHAVITLTGRTDLGSVVDECLDHALTAMVLFDHLCDWPADVDHGRSNLFVESVLGGTSADLSGRASVYRALLLADPIPPYIAAIHAAMARAAELSRALRSPELEHHVRELAVAMKQHSQEMRTFYREQAQAAEALFETKGGVPDGRR